MKLQVRWHASPSVASIRAQTAFWLRPACAVLDSVIQWPVVLSKVLLMTRSGTIMRDIYRAFLNRVGTDEALALAHDLEHWHGAMEEHRTEIIRLGFAPDGHPGWDDCPHADARRLWERALRLLGDRADELELLRACSRPRGDRPHAFVRQPWPGVHRRADREVAAGPAHAPAPTEIAAA